MTDYRAFAAAALLLTTTDALACGGFFCNRDPIDQSSERIVFSIDEAEGTVDVHVQVSYTGPAEAFAWVVPVPDVPELFLSPEELFNVLEAVTRPTFRLNTSSVGTCDWGRDDTYWPESGGGDSASLADLDTAAGAGAGTPEVTLVASQQLGPYETATLSASSADALITWLTTHDYLVPADIGPKLAPYVASGSYFVALRLQKDRVSGDIAPFGMTYAGTTPVIPITLTSVAATPDMRLVPYVLASARAVPTNYLHVTINDAGVDWFRPDGQYDDLITQAANEAGGQAFATDYAGTTQPLRGSLWRVGQFRPNMLATMTDLPTFMEELLTRQSFTASNVLLSLLRRHVPMPAALVGRVPEQSFYNCVTCYPESASIVFDPVAFAADLDTWIVQPRRHAEELFTDHAWVTRMTSSMSPDEMTLDPMFDLNAALAAVPREHAATLTYDCAGGEAYDEALRTLTLADGREILLPSLAWLAEQDQTSSTFIEDLTAPAALLIEDLSPEEEPAPVVDNTEQVKDHADRFNAQTRLLLGLSATMGGADADADGASSGLGCGCATGGTAPARGLGALLAVALLGWTRRRR